MLLVGTSQAGASGAVGLMATGGQVASIHCTVIIPVEGVGSSVGVVATGQA
jgi:hypothetical protein